MLKNHHVLTISSMMPIVSTECATELDSTATNNNRHCSIESNKNISYGKCNIVTKWFHRLLRMFACLNIEERGSEPVSSEDRTDAAIINTAMIWVRRLIIAKIQSLQDYSCL